MVYERSEAGGRATFLSGNGPLVAVLQDALRSRAFVRDLHAFIRTYAITSQTRVPAEHVIVFDERAWDAAYLQAKRNVAGSEPGLLVQVGERPPGWAALVGLVGEGQEIHSGEEAGLGQWRDAAVPPKAAAEWHLARASSSTCPLVCWGEDVRWQAGRGRDGLVVFLPSGPALDETEHILLAAGVRPLPVALDLAAEA